MRDSRAESRDITRVICEQLSPQVGDLEGNERLVVDAVARSIAAGADVVILPELATSGYVFDSADEARSVSLGREDPFFERVSEVLRGTDVVVVFGFCELGSDSSLYNSAAVVSGSGLLSVYRKTHLWDREKLFFTPGDGAPPVLDTAHGRIGVLICYDLEFSEMPRQLALEGADLIAVPTNWPLSEHPPEERAAEIINAQAAARANGVFIACCDRRGVERGQAWTQGTVIVNQLGWVQSVAEHPDHRAVADILTRLARDKSVSPHNDLFADRRPDIYSQKASTV